MNANSVIDTRRIYRCISACGVCQTRQEGTPAAAAAHVETSAGPGSGVGELRRTGHLCPVELNAGTGVRILHTQIAERCGVSRGISV